MTPVQIGTLKKQPQGFKAFIPNPFPPKGGFQFTSNLLKKYAQSYVYAKYLDIFISTDE